jgi:hypothetical protein
VSVTVEIRQWLGEGNFCTRSVSFRKRCAAAPVVHLERLCDPVVSPKSHRSKSRSHRPIASRSALESSASPLRPLTPKMPLDHNHQLLCPLVPRWCVTDSGFAHYGSLFLAPDRSHHGPATRALSRHRQSRCRRTDWAALGSKILFTGRKYLHCARVHRAGF